MTGIIAIIDDFMPPEAAPAPTVDAADIAFSYRKRLRWTTVVEQLAS
jgi:hypothetical protein